MRRQVIALYIFQFIFFPPSSSLLLLLLLDKEYNLGIKKDNLTWELSTHSATLSQHFILLKIHFWISPQLYNLIRTNKGEKIYVKSSLKRQLYLQYNQNGILWLNKRGTLEWISCVVYWIVDSLKKLSCEYGES